MGVATRLLFEHKTTPAIANRRRALGPFLTIRETESVVATGGLTNAREFAVVGVKILISLTIVSSA